MGSGQSAFAGDNQAQEYSLLRYLCFERRYEADKELKRFVREVV